LPGKQRPASRRQRDDLLLLAHVRSSFARSRQTYGSRRIRQDIQAEGLTVGRHRIARLMQDFSTNGPNEKWGVDITYVWTTQGWLYLAIVLDLFSRRIIGWAVSDRITKALAITALNRAIALRTPLPGVIHHSDRGSQYCSHDYQKILTAHGFLASMSGKGNCYDCDYVVAA
jgi:transposase InsO family protein